MLRTRSAPDSATSRIRPSGPREHLAAGPDLGGAGRGVRVGERDARHAVLDRLLRSSGTWLRAGGQPDDLERVRARA